MTKPRNWKKWTSLSIAGAAVGGSGVAGIITTTVGTTYNWNDSPLVLDLPGINDMRVTSSSGGFQRSVALGGVSGATYFQVHRAFQGTTSGSKPFIVQSPSGQTFNVTPGSIAGAGFLGVVDTTFGAQGPSNYSNAYFNFAFKDSTAGGALRYGWIQISTSTPGASVSSTIHRYAYDDSGVAIGAGATSAVPEPGTIGMLGLGALALGATGVRRWRKSKA